MKALPLAVLLASLVFACGDDVDPLAPSAGPTDSPTAAPTPTPRNTLPGTWEGSYEDAGGAIGGDFCVVLAINDADAITGEVQFGAEDVLPVAGGAVGDSFGFEWGSAIGGGTPAAPEVVPFFAGGRIEGALAEGMLAGTWLSMDGTAGAWDAGASGAEGCD